MNDADYYKSQFNEILNSPPPKMESYYNQSFVDRMNEARANIDNLVAEKDKAWSAGAQKQDDYKAFYGSTSSYGEVYTNSKSEFGVEEHQDNYEKSKKALALAESTLNALPSSINASSNRVLTQSQREARYNALANKQMAYRDNLMARTTAYEEVWKKARENQAAYATAEISSQYSKLSDYNNAYIKAMDEYLHSANKLTQGKIELLEWQKGYRDWQWSQHDLAQTEWLTKMDDALKRYQTALDAEASIRASKISIMEQQANQRLAKAIVNGYYRVRQAKMWEDVAKSGGMPVLSRLDI